jgi:hypothetical protein
MHEAFLHLGCSLRLAGDVWVSVEGMNRSGSSGAYTEDLVQSLIATVTQSDPSGTDFALLGGEALAWRWGG